MYNIDLLTNAIVEQACKDYIRVKTKILRRGDIRFLTIDERRIYNDCISFFKSDWFVELCPNIDGLKMISMLDERVRFKLEGKRKKSKKKKESGT